MKNTLLSAAIVGALFVSAAHAAPVPNAGTGGVMGPRGGGTVLYSQIDSPAANGVPDQDFEVSFDSYDSFAADDFVVPGSATTGWTITAINTVGTTGTPGGSLVDVSIHANSPGGGDPDLPGAALCSYTDISPSDTAGSFALTLPTPCIVGPGTYWVQIQTGQNFASNGQHFWSNRSVQTGSEAVWRNPGGGFATTCVNFTPNTVCGVGGGAAPDYLFEVVGALGGLTPPGPVPALSNTMLWTLMGLFSVFGLVAVRKRFA